MPGVPFQSLVEPGGFEIEYGTPPPFIIAPYAATTNVDARTRSLAIAAKPVVDPLELAPVLYHVVKECSNGY